MNGLNVLHDQSTGATGAVALSVKPGCTFRIIEVRITLSDVGGAGNLTGTINDGSGVVYDHVEFTQDMSALNKYSWLPDNDIILFSGDSFDVAYPNASNRTYGLTVVYEVI